MLSDIFYIVYFVSLCFSTGMAFLFLVLRPYKKWSHNIIEGSVFLYLTIMTGLNLFVRMALFRVPTQFAAGVVLNYILSLVPAVYFTIVIIKKLLCSLRSCCTGRRHGYKRLRGEDEGDEHRCLDVSLLDQTREYRNQ